MVRILADLMIGLALFAGLLYAVYRMTAARNPPPELDISQQPSLWFVDTRAVNDGTQTEYGIVRVEEQTRQVLERRVMGRIENSAEDYDKQLDAAQDRAYEAMRVANLGLRRR